MLIYFLLIWITLTIIGLITMFIAADKAPTIEYEKRDHIDYDLNMTEEDRKEYLKLP